MTPTVRTLGGTAVGLSLDEILGRNAEQGRVPRLGAGRESDTPALALIRFVL